MKNFYTLLEKLYEHRIYYCFQAQSKSVFYNLAVHDIHKKENYFHSSNLKDIEQQLMKLWGHLLTEKVMPAPMGLPQP